VPSSSESAAITVVFAPRADGGPLMVWQVGATMKSAILANDGRSFTTPQQLPFDGVGRLVGTTAAYVGGAFYVIAPTADPGNPMVPPLGMVRIDSDGAVGTAVDVLPNSGARNLALVSGADDLRVVYIGYVVGGGGTDTTTYFQKIDATGAPASAPVVLADSLDPAGAFGYGTETVSVLSSHPAAGTSPSALRLDGIRIGGTGQIATPQFPMMSAPSGLAGHLTEQNVARVGSDIVALWYTTSGIRLARVTP